MDLLFTRAEGICYEFSDFVFLLLLLTSYSRAMCVCLVETLRGRVQSGECVDERVDYHKFFSLII